MEERREWKKEMREGKEELGETEMFSHKQVGLKYLICSKV